MKRVALSDEQVRREVGAAIETPQGRSIIGQTINNPEVASEGLKNSSISVELPQGQYRGNLRKQRVRRDYTKNTQMSDDIVRTVQQCTEVPRNVASKQEMILSYNNMPGALKIGGLVKPDDMLENGVNAFGTGEPSENLKAVPAISRKLVNMGTHGVPGEDFVTCAICGFKATQISNHVIRTHGMAVKKYHEQYPGRKTICNKLNAYKSEKIGATVKKFWNSEIGKQLLTDANEKRIQTNLKKYGMKFPNQKLAQEAIAKKLNDPVLGPQYQARMNAGVISKFGVKNCMRNYQIREKAVSRGQAASFGCPNKTELRLASLLPDFVSFTGDGTFWVDFNNGHQKNPDFVVRPFSKWHKVIELFGEHVHTPEEALEVVANYKEIGIDCLIVWSNQFINERMRKVLKEQIVDFLTMKTSSSETLCREADAEICPR